MPQFAAFSKPLPIFSGSNGLLLRRTRQNCPLLRRDSPPIDRNWQDVVASYVNATVFTSISGCGNGVKLPRFDEKEPPGACPGLSIELELGKWTSVGL